MSASSGNPPPGPTRGPGAPDLDETKRVIGAAPSAIGHYLLQGELGRGGMGRVFLAEDTRLGRTVAVKLLPDEFARVPGRMERLRREARLLAAVNHPNIGAIYSLEEPEPDNFFLVLEYVPGENLASRLARGALPPAEAIRVAAQIALALAAAHAREVIHRDLKPANVMLTPDGRVKVLDFGLARRGHEEAGERAGTPGYMSPEQILRGSADERSDVFALGCILYECLVGRPAFGTGPVEEVLAATLSREPARSLLPPGLPDGTSEFLARCLGKDPEGRFRGGGEALGALERLLRREEEQPLPGTPARTPQNLPPELTAFVGREAERANCARMLGRTRLLTLTGMGGSGKTRLALKLAGERLADYPDGVWFVDLAPVQEGTRVARAVGDAMGLRVGGGAAAALCRHLESRRVLLVWDTCEHVVEACAELAAELLRRAPRVTVLATSREPLRIEGERVFAVPPLRLRPESGEPPAAPSEAARLFSARAASNARAAGSAGAETLALVEDICRRLDGIPLAIELAAARARVLSLAEIRERLADRLRFLAADRGRGRDRHRALRATFDWSYDLLSPEEARLFRALAVLEPDFAIDAAAAVHGGVTDEIRFLDLFTRLVDKSLVAPASSDADSSRFRLLDTLREYALQRLSEAGEEDAARDRHVLHYLSLGEAAAPELIGPRQAVWLRRLSAEHANLLAALANAARSPRLADRGLRLAGALWRFWIAHGHFELGRRELRRAFDRAAGHPPSAARFEALLGIGALAFHQNDWAASAHAYQECVALSQRLGYSVGLGYALAGLGNVALGREEYDGARARYEEAIQCFERGAHQRGVGLSLSNLGRVAELTGAYAEAHSLYERSLAIFRAIGDRAPLALRLSSLSELSVQLGYRDAARMQLAECFDVVLELGEKRAGAYALERTAALAAAEGDAEAAARFLGAAASLRGRIASPLTPREEVALEAPRAAARGGLGAAEFERRFESGGGWTFHSAVREALDWLARAPRGR